MSTVIHARRPGLRSWLILIACEAKMVARDTAGLIVPFGLPLLILLSSAGAAGDQEILNGLTALDLYVLPLVIVIVIAMIGIVNMPSFLAYYRRSGILRRLGVTPASPAMVLVAQVVVSSIQAIFGIAVALAVAFVAFGASPPVDLGVAVAVGVLAMAAMYSAGMVVAAVAPTPNSAVAIGLVVFFAFGALGGMFAGREALPEFFAELGGWLPFGAAVDAISAAWAGMTVEATSLLSLGATVIIGAGVSALLFRWE